ncbi:MAG: hypothetical protein KAH38_05350, partial [Candidatus Hydrogenedentes bacterium]|nr:hypothetical protein [Candidatus Hydrogenedentota bacterium]
FGLLDSMDWNAQTVNNGRDYFHLLGLRAYFLATRDLDANGNLDFDFRARTQQKESWDLPPTTMLRGGTGPVIYVSQQ